MEYNFSKQINAIVKRTNIKIENVIEKVAREISNRVVMATPVDTGALRGNWFPAYEQPHATYNLGLSDLSGGEAMRAINASIRGNKMIGKVWYLTNSMPYAYRIEYEGWSHTKAPAGMVRISVAGYRDALNQALK